ncbi:MAG: hypothetical protein ACYC5O_02160 [Anaerolineae bacterium]
MTGIAPLPLQSPDPAPAPTRDEPGRGVTPLAPEAAPRRDRRAPAVAAGLFGLLLSVYLLTFGGKLHSLDEYSTLAVASSLVKNGTLQSDQMAWAWAGDYSQDAPGIDGHLYTKKGLGAILWVAPFYALGLALPNAGLAHAGLLSGAVAAAIGAVAVFYAALAMTRTLGTAVWLALLYGLGTIVFPYSKYLFTEGPAAAAMAVLLLGLAWYLCGKRARTAALLLAGAGAAATLLVRPAGALAVPFALVAIAWPGPGRRERGLKALVVAVAVFLLPVAVALAAMAGTNWARFGNPLETGYTATESFNAPLWEGLRGLILSPGKSLFLYSPPLLLALLGLPAAARRWPRLTLFSVGTALAHVGLYSTWYGWDGGWCWGPRFLVPIVPLLLPLALPAIEWALRRGIAGRAALAATALLSLAVQLGGSLVDYVEFNNYLISRGIPTGLYYEWRYNPILGQLAALSPARLQAAMLDLGWVRAVEGQAPLRWAPLLVALVCVGSAGYCLVRLLRGKRPRLHGALAIALPLAGLCLSLVLYGNDPWYGDQVELGPALEALAPRLEPGDAVAVEVLPYLHFYGQAAYLLNTSRLDAPTLVLLRREPQVGEVEQGLLAANLEGNRRLWLLLGATPLGHQASTTERWCAERAYLAEQVWLSGSTRASLFVDGSHAEPIASGSGAPLDDGISLDRYSVALEPGGSAADAASLLIELDWSAAETLARRYTVFLQLLGPDGLPVAQVDREPLGGLSPTPGWLAGQSIADRYAIEVPPGVSGEYTLIAGMYDSETGARLATAGGDHFVLATIPLGR